MSNFRKEWTDAVGRLQMAKKPRSKYGAVKVTVDGITFDSKREAQRYHELKLMEKAGQIMNLRLQPEFALRAWQNGNSPIVGTYIADFSYLDILTNNRIVEDVKGFKTPLYRWKKKHVEAQYGIQIREV
jgi:hypothetical protein